LFRGICLEAFLIYQKMTVEKTNLPIEKFPDPEKVQSYYGLYMYAKENKLFDSDGNINIELIFNSKPHSVFSPHDRIHFEAEKWSITYTPGFIAEKLAEENYKLRHKHPELTIQEIHTLIHALRNLPPTDLANLSNYKLLEKLKEIYNQKGQNYYPKPPWI